MRVFGWSETWRVAIDGDDDGWRFRIALAPDSTPGRDVPPFLRRTDWEADDLEEGLAAVKADIRRDAEAVRKRVFLVDEGPDDL